MTNECWSCGKAQWLCDMKHFWRPIFEGLFIGLAIGGVFAIVIVCVKNILEWAQ